MWIRTADDLRRHLNDPSSRENHAFEYKAGIDTGKRGRGADFASSVGSLANADGGQVLLGVRDKDGAPDKIIGVGKLDPAGEDIENAISGFLIGIEPRPTWEPHEVDGKTVIVVDVLPSVRLVAYRVAGERNKIMYPVRTGGRLRYMRPEDVEARILSYGPRAQRIMLERLLDETGSETVTLYHSVPMSGRGVPSWQAARLWSGGPGRVESVDSFGIRLAVEQRTKTENRRGEVWVPYRWLTAFLTKEAWDGAPPSDSFRVGLMLFGTLEPPNNFGTRIRLLPPASPP